MTEVTGDLWTYKVSGSVVRCVTTNGLVKARGEAVMGRGCAYEAMTKFPMLPGLLGDHIKRAGNVPGVFSFGQDWLMSFPVKHNWWEPADLKLIANSADILNEVAQVCKATTFLLPRPGCGNGKLKWSEVRPVIQHLPDNVMVISK